MIQDEIANAIVSAIKSELGLLQTADAIVVKADTENLDAYELYLEARSLFLARLDLGRSIRLFNQGDKLVLTYFWRSQFVLSGFAQHLASHFARSFSYHSYAISNDRALDRSPGAEKHMDVRERPNCFASYGTNSGEGETGNRSRGWPGPSLMKCSG